MTPAFWSGRRVFVTGHTGFKGTWLCRWLTMLGAEVTGYSLDDGAQPADGTRSGARQLPTAMRDLRGDVRDLHALRGAVRAAEPEVLFHLAAHSLVRRSYIAPVATFTTNVIGTVHVLECLRTVPTVRVGILVTSDKCYANDGGDHAFREDDVLGGTDPYSASKAAAELAIAAYRESYAPDLPRVVAVRAGNVIGGGDWSADRLVPDLVRAFGAGVPAAVRFPSATRPWQFVLDALHGYLCAAEQAHERTLPPSFNFGPLPAEAHPVRLLVDAMAARWGDGASWAQMPDVSPHPDAPTLALDATRAREVLGWRPLLDAEQAIAWTTDWYKSARDLTDEQLTRFMELASA